ncbi:hypothetical protein [Flavobacterium soyangense]|nr:hypothetical protein [Flavobacterium soyangense]
MTSIENNDSQDEHCIGKGFYNEFGINSALGFDDTHKGGWFHKIGIGLLKKEDSTYLFSKKYAIKPAKFEVITEPDKIVFICKSEDINGYSYLLKKEIELHNNSFIIKYYLENTGEKDIITNEYVHNFTAINKDSIGSNYVLKFPFQLKPELFGETVNPEQKVEIGLNEIKFNGSPKNQFFFSNLSGSENVNAAWELTNLKSNIKISETASFQTNQVNLWGWEHVISPELFVNIFIKPGQSTEWSRIYNFYNVN